MNALVGLFGNTPDGIAKARSIVAGGDGHFNNVYTKLQAYDGDVNEIVSLTKGILVCVIALALTVYFSLTLKERP